MKWTGAALVIFIVVSTLHFSGCKSDGGLIDTVATPLAPIIERLRVAEPYYNKKVQLKTRVYYRANGYRRTWLGKRKPKRLFEAFLDEVRESATYGFVPEEYYVDQLKKAADALYSDKGRTVTDLSNLDIRITASFFLFTTHLLEGRIRYAGAREYFWKKGMPLENDIVLLLKIASDSDLRKTLRELHPDDRQYERLQEALRKYRDLERADTLPPVPPVPLAQPGQAHSAVQLLRQKLHLMGDLKGKPSSSARYDDELERAVMHFQSRHGVKPDGIPGEETVALLNVPMRERADVIALNLERLRWHPRLEFEHDAVVINVPEYMLRVYRNNKERMQMRVVLGSEYTPTPVFYDTLKYLVFSPTWTVPASIFEKEFLPVLQRDSFQFSPERFKFYRDSQPIDPYEEDWTDEELDASRYTLIETPGEANALGKVKFIMPNDFSVYLHDTPASRLFDRDERALSHGCIRVEKPVDLARYLLRDQQGWDEENIRQAMEAGKPQKVDLEKNVPVYIIYRTAWVDDSGDVHFRKDIYGHDRRQMARLSAAISYHHAPMLPAIDSSESWKRLSSFR